MNRLLFDIKILFIIGILAITCQNGIGKDSGAIFNKVKESFKSPNRGSGVNCWWWWLNGNVNKAAITKDLEAMKSKNFQGAMIFDAGGHNQRGGRDIPDGPLFGSGEWNELFVFALDEAKRLGLEMGFNIQSGWNLGGPRVTPKYAAKQLTYSERRVTGGSNAALQLEQPASRLDFYKDIAVLAFPVKSSAKIKEGISDLDLKLGFHEMGGSAPDCRFLLENEPRNKKEVTKETYLVQKSEIIDLSGKMDEQGKLEWNVPAGEWVVLRIGYTCTGSHVSTSSGGWQGNVLDYMSREAFDFYWNDVVEPVFKAAGGHVGTTLKYMETDSWECGGMNWTDKFAEEFRQYRGYDLINYLPIAAGYVVDDMETSNAFLADFRKTLGDLVAYNHYARFQEYAHKYNMGIQPESAGPHAGPLDGIKNYGFSDIVMSEFWSPSPHRPQPDNRFFLKQASSAAHIYGKKIVGAESFTTIGPHWNDEIGHDQKPAFDHEICAGLNRMYFHTFTCSPPEMGLPGQEYFAGTHINPQVTWWEQSEAFIDYMHRIQSVVQEGNFVADVLYYYGDHVPNVFPFKHADPAGVMPGFDYDVTDETIFLQLKVEDGKIVVPGGVRYRVLVLPNHKVLSMAVLEKVESLLKQGARVIGYKPEKLVSLSGGEKEQKQFHKLADKIWGKAVSGKGEKKYGQGLIVWGMSAREYLLSKNVPADFDIKENDSETDFDYIHYKVGESDVYFVTNQTTDRQKINCRFRVSGLQPELWDALTGDMREVKAFTQTDGLTSVPLILEPYESVFVIFNKKIEKEAQGPEKQNYPDYRTVKNIEGEWVVNFDPKWGGPASVTFPGLTDWSKHQDERIRFYSGTAVYNKTFKIDFDLKKDEQYFLRLENVKDVGIAEVKINGKDKGILWTKPFRVNVSKELQKGENTLEIKVVNSWYNRVAGDRMFPDKKQYTSTNIDLKHDFRGRPVDEVPLEPSGLLGPVTIEKAVIKKNSLFSATAANPILPATAFIPDGEPHVFEYKGEKRVFLYGSRDERITGYCGFGHDVWSAPVDNLSQWTNHGEVFNVKQVQDIGYGIVDQQHFGAPDCVYNPVTKKYYLYTFLGAPYHLDGKEGPVKEVGTAVPGFGNYGPKCVMAQSDSPAGPFLDPVMCDWPAANDKGTFDPAVLVDEQKDGSVRVFAYWGMCEGDRCAEIDPLDMHTIIDPVTRKPDRNAWRKTLPPKEVSNGSTLFEASSIRKLDKGKYVFIYSANERGSALTYCYGNSPLGPWHYGGRIIDNGVNWRGGNNHGSIVEINGDWYVFYHRHTAGGINRQAMMEPIAVHFKGEEVNIPTVEMTSQASQTNGLNPFQRYNIGICCYSVGGGIVAGVPRQTDGLHPMVGIKNGTVLGFKYFNFGEIRLTNSDDIRLKLNLYLLRDASMTIQVAHPGAADQGLARVDVMKVILGDYVADDGNYHDVTIPLSVLDGNEELKAFGGLKGKLALFLCFEGGDGDCCHIKEIEFAKGDTPAPNLLMDVRIPGNIANGRIFATPSKARYGESVKLTVLPESGFGLKLIRVRDEAGNDIEVNRNADVPHGSVSFNFHMPQSPVLVEAEFK